MIGLAVDISGDPGTGSISVFVNPHQQGETSKHPNGMVFGNLVGVEEGLFPAISIQGTLPDDQSHITQLERLRLPSGWSVHLEVGFSKTDM